jgi:hypothetical protein
MTATRATKPKSDVVGQTPIVTPLFRPHIVRIHKIFQLNQPPQSHRYSDLRTFSQGGLGGFASDTAHKHYSVRGRIWVQFVLLAVESGCVFIFATTKTLASSIVVLVFFSIFIQSAEGLHTV